jgi:hypothetical protein
LVALILLACSPVAAITHGQPDDAEHDYVGELLFFVPDSPSPGFEDPGAWFTCSGTLVSPIVVVTAGHCTFAIGLDGESTTNGGEATNAAEGGDGGNDVWIDFGEAADFDGFPPSADYGPDENQQRYEDRRDFLNGNPNWHRGTAHPHPLYDDLDFVAHDAGVVVLDEPVERDVYGTIPTVDWLDQYRGRAHSSTTFEVVGYGVTASGPKTEAGGDVRMKGLVRLHSLNSKPKDAYAVFSNTPSRKASGGTCFGDSGGPVFDGTDSNLIVAINSWVNSVTCGGLSGGYRIDQPDDLAFLAEFGISP